MSDTDEKSTDLQKGQRHPCICPVCMSWLSEHKDPFLKKEGWVVCNSCRYAEKRKVEEPKPK